MSTHLRRCLLPVILFAFISGFSPALGRPEPIRELTILYTNDFHSAFDPIPAYWLPGSTKLGGAAHWTLINQIRTRKDRLFCSTPEHVHGYAPNLTRGEALMEMMTNDSTTEAIGNTVRLWKRQL
jgi:2',3'-cyclic-nucleotide 2'-phosphodiesterase (5'-nucleotidase family)